MKRVIACCAVLCALSPMLAWGAEFGVHGTTIVRFEERSFSGQPKERIIPGTQFLGADVVGLADGNLSLHLYGWGRVDFADASTPGTRRDGELSYGYLRYLFPKANGEIRAGRFYVNSGVAHEHVDGLLLQSDLAAGVTGTLYGGAPVRFDNDNRGDYVAGGRVAFRRPGWLEVGVSAVEEKGAVSQRNLQGTPPAFTVADRRELIGADIWLAAGSSLELSGLSSYNPVVSSLAEHNYLLLVRPVKGLTLSGLFVERRYKGYFAGTNLPQLFRPDRDEGVHYGGSVTYAIAEPVEISADYRRIHRDSLGNTDRFGAGARFLLKALSSRAGIEYHRNSGPDVATALVAIPSYSLSYHEARGWFAYDRSDYLFSADLIGHFYDDSNNPSLNGRSDDFEAVVSAGYRILKNLTVSADVSYGYNPQLKEEFRALARAEFGWTYAGKGGAK